MTPSLAPPFGNDVGRGGEAPAAAGRLLSTVLGALRDGGEAAARNHLLVLRFGVVNMVAGALLAATWLQGWTDAVLAGDSTRLVWAIVAVFLAGLALCARKVVETSRELNRVGAPPERAGARGRSRAAAYCRAIEGRDAQSRAIIASALRLKLSARIAVVRHFANSLVFLGLIGTVVGFIVALSGVDPEAAADVTAIGPMVSILIGGMSIALHTTLVGSVLNIWLMVNYRLLETGTVDLITAIVERGERHAQP